MVIGYLRVSTGKQNLANQQDEIRRFAESRNFTVNSWVTEVVSGSKNERDRKLGALLKRMKPGDTLIVTEISRLSRTLTDIMAIMGKCLSREINLYTTKEGYSFDDSINSKVLCFAFGLVAEIERNLISMRTKEALALRKAEGVALGRRKGSYTKTNVLIENRQAVVDMLNADRSIADICRRFDVSRDTFAKFRKRYPSVQKAVDAKEERRIRAAGRGEAERTS
ncbi:MAG TPA: recombinase family protein [Candidatus Tidjanibacter gallistercoris]|nr:recombinase family protein [Candidatus Tidjanibacter gallistercoris]